MDADRNRIRPPCGDRLMLWTIANRAHHEAQLLADRHYNRQKPGSPQFVPPGRCLVLYTKTITGQAFWVTSWPFSQYVKHRWPGAWVCSAFRNENAGKASDLISDAVAATLAYYGDPPPLGMLTFVDESKVKPTLVRGAPVWGWTYRRAGFEEDGYSKGGLLALRLSPERMPAPTPAIGAAPYKHKRTNT